MSEYQYVEHEFAPVYNEESQVLVLGSLPSVNPESRASTTDIRETVFGRLWQLYLVYRNP